MLTGVQPNISPANVQQGQKTQTQNSQSTNSVSFLSVFKTMGEIFSPVMGGNNNKESGLKKDKEVFRSNKAEKYVTVDDLIGRIDAYERIMDRKSNS